MASRAAHLVKTALEHGCAPLHSQHLGRGVDVIVVQLPSAASDLPGEEKLLSAEERARAATYCFQKDRDAFVRRRAVLRRWLAGLLDMSPEALPLEVGPYGKPFIGRNIGDNRISDFNLSHSTDMLALAVSRHGKIGLDIEQRKTLPDMDAMFAAICSPNELALFETFPDSERNQLFFQLWTAKEATLKALGTGLLQSPRPIELRLDTVLHPPRLRLHSPDGCRLWSSLLPGGTFLSVVASQEA